MPLVRLLLATVCLLFTFQARADEQGVPESAASLAGAISSVHAPVTFTLVPKSPKAAWCTLVL